VLALLAIAAIFEDYDSMRTERQALFLSSLALSLLSMSCAPASGPPPHHTHPIFSPLLLGHACDR